MDGAVFLQNVTIVLNIDREVEVEADYLIMHGATISALDSVVITNYIGHHKVLNVTLFRKYVSFMSIFYSPWFHAHIY